MASLSTKPPRRPWTREETLLALNLYYRTPFGRQHSRNPEIIQLASVIGRTPDSVSMKLNNFTSLDPLEQARGVSGLKGASNLDRAIWEEFHANAEAVAAESELLWQQRVSPTPTPRPSGEPGIPGTLPTWQPFTGPDEALRQQRVRLGQSFFRKTVLANYNYKCCITGLDTPELLRASHIVPWSESSEHRVNPSNGLCLSALHDAAFDRYLISVNPDNLHLHVSPRLMQSKPATFIEQHFLQYQGKPIALPERHLPERTLIQRHYHNTILK